MPTKQQIRKKRKQQWYNDNAPEVKRRKKQESKKKSQKLSDRNKIYYRSTTERQKAKAHKAYSQNSDMKKMIQRENYADNPDPKKNKQREQYLTNPDPKKAKQRKQYLTNPNPKKAKQREQYIVNKEIIRGKLRKFYKRNRMSRLKYFRLKYQREILAIRQLNRSKYSTKSKQEVNFKSKLQSSTTAVPVNSKKSRRRIRRKNNTNSILIGNINTEKVARIIAKKLRGSSMAKRLLRAKNMLKWLLYGYKLCKINFRKAFHSLQSHCKDSVYRLSSDQLSNIVENLCGKSLHTSYTEPFFREFSYNIYQGKAIAVDSQHLAVNIFPSFATVPTKSGGTKYEWKCSNEVCRIQTEEIESNLKPLMTKIIATNSLKPAVNLISELTTHNDEPGIGTKAHSMNCYTGRCTSKIPFLRTISPHFPEIRRFISVVNKLVKTHQKMIVISDAIKKRNIKLLLQLEAETEKNKVFLRNVAANLNTLIEADILKMYPSAFSALEHRSFDTPILPCVSCEKLFSKSQVALLRNLKVPIISEVWKQLQRIKQEETKNGYICRSCQEKIKKGNVPSTCILNGFQIETQPKELQCLNSYEKILIQRAKAFQVVTKMNSVGKRKFLPGQQISKVVGRSFHLPLPIEETLKRLPAPSDPLNLEHELYILVRGVPTKSKQIWQMIVDVKKIFSALRFLREHNKFYSQIALPEEPQHLLPSSTANVFTLSGAIKEQVDQPVLLRRAILTQVPPEEWEEEESHYTIHALHEAKICTEATELYKMLKVSEPPIGYENKDIDVLCFPDLFPYGKFGQFHPRQTYLTSSEFIKSRLLSKHSCYRLNQQYLFYLLHDANIRQLKQGIFHKLNVTDCGGRLTAADCLRSIESGDLEGNLTSIFSKLRNTSQFWVQPRNDVQCMAQHYGPATWFLTISPSEWNWDDLAHFIKEANKDSPDLETKTTSQLVSLDPVSASRFINLKFMAMLDFITSVDAPLGKVVHYFYRREYQSRGLQHFHLLLWVENAPILGLSSNSEVANFILKYISCRLPEKSLCPILYDRVSNYQTHHHNTYCLRNKKTNTGFRKVCRFGFPRSVTTSLVLRDIIESVAGRKSLRSGTRLYDLPRTPRESNINDYNPAILLAWNGNVDLQFVGEKTSILHWYVTKYTTKSEHSHVGDAFAEMNSTKSLSSRLFNIGLRALNNRECGALEASDTLLSLPLYGSDPETTVRWLDVSLTRKRRLLPIDKLKTMNPGSANIFFESWVDNYYPDRPENLDSMTLYDFTRWFDISKTELKSERETYKIGPQKFLIKRKRAYLINHYKYNVTQDSEKYYHALLLMFLPWRTLYDVRKDYQTYKEAFMSQKDLLQQAFSYDARLQEQIDIAEKTKAAIQARVQEFEAEDADIHVDPSNVAFTPAEPAVIPKVMNYERPVTTEEPFEELYAKLNADQLRVFHHVQQVILDQNGEKNILRLFVSGVGGTGKSFLIKTLSHWTKSKLDALTSISAPTGLSAYNINGYTIYKVFQLPVEHGKTPKYRALSDEALKALRFELKNVVLFIIDEISMVSNLTLMYINLRLIEIFNTADEVSGWFGKRHILLFGDLLQLPPVHEDSPFVQLSSSKLNQYVGSLSCLNMWCELFSYDELSINMRQAQDQQYADMLGRIRIGAINSSDINFLLDKRIPLNRNNISENLKEIGDYLLQLPLDTVCLCSTGHQCIKINEEMLRRLDGPLINLVARDSVDCQPKQTSKVNRLLQTYEKDCSRTAGMEREIIIKLGVKIMLRRNIDVTLGLVNSAIGIIRNVSYNIDKPNEVEKLDIDFDNGVTHQLQRVTSKFEIMDNAFVFREQFPISLSYAVTIHKCQGLSLKNVVMDIGESVFCCGQTYVALSRVTHSNGLHLINFNPRDVKSQISAVLEYNRLRQKYKPDLPVFDTGVINLPPSYIKDRPWCLSRLVDTIQQDVPDESAKKNSKNIPSRTSTISIRGFANADISCYSNAVLQLLYSNVKVRRVIKDSNNVCHELKHHLRCYEEVPEDLHLDTVQIRALAENADVPTYSLQEQQDSALFLIDLLQRNSGLKDLLAFYTETTIVCQQCGYVLTSTQEIDTILRVPVTTMPTTLNDQIQRANYDKWEHLEDYRCQNTNCSSVGTSRRKIHIIRTNPLLAVQFLIFTNDGNKISTNNITKVSTSQIFISGKTYHPTAAIFHHGDTISHGHYTCMVKTGTSWISINDNIVEKKRWPAGSKSIYMILLSEK